ncbi:hypothetical protein PDE01_49470 [Paracoccus denitrificans]|nr:hypothetical protein PDE01_49470 [Paracoccus denitrificans]
MTRSFRRGASWTRIMAVTNHLFIGSKGTPAMVTRAFVSAEGALGRQSAPPPRWLSP